MANDDHTTLMVIQEVLEGAFYITPSSQLERIREILAFPNSILALPEMLAERTQWTPEQWEQVMHLANSGTRPSEAVLRQHERGFTGILEAHFTDLRLGWHIIARRSGPNPVQVSGQIYDIRAGKITFDPQGRFYIYAAGWKFYREQAVKVDTRGLEDI